MESNGNNRGGLLSAGGVLSITLGIFQVISGLLLGTSVLLPNWPWFLERWWPVILSTPFLRDVLGRLLAYGSLEDPELMLVAVCVGVLGIVAIVGGISAIRRNIFSLSLAGAICALPSGFLGILPITFVALGRREFQGVGG